MKICLEPVAVLSGENTFTLANDKVFPFASNLNGENRLADGFSSCECKGIPVAPPPPPLPLAADVTLPKASTVMSAFVYEPAVTPDATNANSSVVPAPCIVNGVPICGVIATFVPLLTAIGTPVLPNILKPDIPPPPPVADKVLPTKDKPDPTVSPPKSPFASAWTIAEVTALCLIVPATSNSVAGRLDAENPLPIPTRHSSTPASMNILVVGVKAGEAASVTIAKSSSYDMREPPSRFIGLLK